MAISFGLADALGVLVFARVISVQTTADQVGYAVQFAKQQLPDAGGQQGYHGLLSRAAAVETGFRTPGAAFAVRPQVASRPRRRPRRLPEAHGCARVLPGSFDAEAQTKPGPLMFQVPGHYRASQDRLA